ncbi:hypothetical protein E2C01_012489 [Portunus trituberculatus]|uniref:Uncharacterized protein n=1 Tax=Portunus trituberculatus TaxID=210409 RepID=A0A5B7DDV6_PORTR|nr:hypothetical protein [Portunus trituberculatus]
MVPYFSNPTPPSQPHPPKKWSTRFLKSFCYNQLNLEDLDEKKPHIASCASPRDQDCALDGAIADSTLGKAAQQSCLHEGGGTSCLSSGLTTMSKGTVVTEHSELVL